MLTVDRQEAGAVFFYRRHDQMPRTDKRFLVGKGTVSARPDRSESRPDPDHAEKREGNDIGRDAGSSFLKAGLARNDPDICVCKARLQICGSGFII